MIRTLIGLLVFADIVPDPPRPSSRRRSPDGPEHEAKKAAGRALTAGLAQLRRATDLALGYQWQKISRAEASAILDFMDTLSEERAAERRRADEMRRVLEYTLRSYAGRLPDDWARRVREVLK